MVVRLSRVQGLEGRQNDVLFSPCVRRAPGAAPALVYWGGDVQDYPEVMQAHRDNRNYVKWNLENTARILSQSFPTHHIVVVRPSRIEYKSFSCYDNFVASNNAGVPEHAPSHGALLHLDRLLQEVSNQIKKLPEEELLEMLEAAAPEDIQDLLTSPKEGSSNGAGSNPAPDTLEPLENRLWWRHDLALQQSELTLVGFSKGCVVLNQLLHELHHALTTDTGADATRLISRIRALYWLDGGHAGGHDTWLTSRCLLETLVRLDVDIHVHVSPYQVQDSSRPWIGQEEKVFTTTLRKLGAKVHRHLHAAGSPVTLLTHFNVLSNFRRLQRGAGTAIGTGSGTGTGTDLPGTGVGTGTGTDLPGTGVGTGTGTDLPGTGTHRPDSDTDSTQ